MRNLGGFMKKIRLATISGIGLCTLALTTAFGQTPKIAPTVDDDGTAHIAAFDLPFSAYASPEAKALYVLRARKPLPYFKLAPGTPIAQVRKVMDEEWFGPQLAAANAKYHVTVENQTIGGVHTQVFTPKDGISSKNAHHVLINLHGGGFNVGALINSQVESVPLAAVGRIKVISIDYRMAPEFHFPAASEDVAAVYRELLKTYKHGEIAIYGCSAGGMLTGEAVAWFQKVGLPAPASIGIFCASTRVPMLGDSAYVTPRLGGILPAPRPESAIGYFEGSNLSDPLVAPSASPSVLAKFPPTLIITGTRSGDMSAASRTAIDLAKAGVDARLYLWDGVDHSFFVEVGLPESQEAYDIMVKFFEEHFDKTRT
jgi:acetyl esterase/lipase